MKVVARPAGNRLPMSIGDAVYQEIRTDILFGAFRPGTKLKLEGLRQRYDVSINTLRESLARLSSDGLVLAEGQKGFRVVPVSLSDLRDITEMRQLLGCHALRRAIERGDLEWPRPDLQQRPRRRAGAHDFGVLDRRDRARLRPGLCVRHRAARPTSDPAGEVSDGARADAVADEDTSGGIVCRLGIHRQGGTRTVFLHV
jgi:hypothetical protein